MLPTLCKICRSFHACSLSCVQFAVNLSHASHRSARRSGFRNFIVHRVCTHASSTIALFCIRISTVSSSTHGVSLAPFSFLRLAICFYFYFFTWPESGAHFSSAFCEILLRWRFVLLIRNLSLPRSPRSCFCLCV